MLLKTPTTTTIPNFTVALTVLPPPPFALLLISYAQIR
jgi:hypothetical protein